MRTSAALAIALAIPAAAAAQADPALAGLREGDALHGFRAAAVYLDGSGAPMGARFVHGHTGFTFDFLRIQSVPQAYLWVGSLPDSDRGEPHTQEHLLLGKGNRGRAVANLETMSLATSTAFVQQWRTQYHFQTAGGPRVFETLLERQLDALLHPDYTDEEIRREVRHFGVAEDADGTLRLEEKGTVYNEMVSTYERPFGLPYRALLQSLYGEAHPLSFSAGGTPEAIREMEPEHIRRFHADRYHLANMGMVAAFPREMALPEVLRSTDAMLRRLQGSRPVRAVPPQEETLPPYRPAPPGSIRFAEYPHQNPAQPSPLFLAWGAGRTLSPPDRVLLELFVDVLAGDATTNLYRVFVDTRTREIDVGARSVGGSVSGDPGHAVFVTLGDVTPAEMTEAGIARVRDRVVEEVRRIAALPDGSAELAELDQRVRSRVVERRRQLGAFVDSPPGFGQRGTGSAWITHLDRLARTAGFRKALTLAPELAEVERMLGTGENVWRGAIARWGLLEQAPVAVFARPSPEMVRAEQEARRARAAAELSRLAAVHGTADEAEALRRFRAGYDAETARLDAVAAEAERSAFVDAPPLGLDDLLDYEVRTVTGGIPLVASTFENMTGATAGLALRLDAAEAGELVFLSALAPLLSEVGVIRGGEPVPYERMRETLRREVLRLSASLTANARTGRVELVVRGAGTDLEESRRALGWMHDVLYHPDWRPENLPRIRDVVDQQLAALRRTTAGSEETWVNDPAAAYRMQRDPLFLATQSFLTRAHNVHRLRWMLMEAPTGGALAPFLASLAEAGGTREERRALLTALLADTVPLETVAPALRTHVAALRALPAAERAVAREAARDLGALLPELPDGSMAADWRYLVRRMAADLALPPSETLGRMDAMRRRLLVGGHARAFVIGSSASQAGLAEGIGRLAAGLDAPGARRAPRDAAPVVDARLRGRDAAAGEPRFVGLVHPSTQSGVILHSAPLVTVDDTDRESVLRSLASRLYAGGGAHSLFMRTWGAGLAYSNGVNSSPVSGRATYYAERVPELPQTVRFVIGELRAARPDPALAEYAVAQSFGELRSAFSYEARGEAMAADLADGMTPARVAAFRRAVLEARRDPGLTGELFSRMEGVYGRLLPGYGPRLSEEGPGAVYMVIGPERQLALWEAYLRAEEDGAARVHRLYPRDFWMVAEPD